MASEPWYRTASRWGQTNLVEIDPTRYDDGWWRAHWRRTRIQGVIVNAGGIVAYYPSAFPLHRRAETLGDRDLYGEIVRSAREEGLQVVARMDSNRVAEEFYAAHPDWICRDGDGEPYRLADKYITCINSPYYGEYLPEILREIIRRTSPDGFADNSWAGIPRQRICYCRHCADRFHSYAGTDLPRRHDWSNEIYRQWIQWSFKCRTDLWDLNNRVTTEAGGDHCRWMGMISGDVLNNSQRFIDLRAILQRSRIVMLDHQRRSATDGFAQNTEAGKRLHELAGWDILIPESTPQYQLGQPAFRLASMPSAEVRLWSSAGFAGGIQPWWHHIGSLHEDRRQYRTAEPIFTWHEANEDVLVRRRPQADVGVVWSQENHDFFGREKANERTADPYRGITLALDAAGITYLPVHAEDVTAMVGRVKVLILPNLAAMSDDQVASVEAFAAAGGSVIATSDTSLCDRYGERRDDFALGRLFGLHRRGNDRGGLGPISPSLESSERHTYLRLPPESGSGLDDLLDGTTPQRTESSRHALFAGLEGTETLPFGGFLPEVGVDKDVTVLATFIPDFPIFPPETAWMRHPRTDLPAITVRDGQAGSKLVWFVADVDRCYARDGAFEHAQLIGNAVRWCLDGRSAVELRGAQGLVTPSLFEQENRQILHLNNRLITAKVPGRQNELVAVGPVTVRLPARERAATPEVELRVSGEPVIVRADGDWVSFDVGTVLDHEVVVVTWPLADAGTHD